VPTRWFHACGREIWYENLINYYAPFLIAYFLFFILAAYNKPILQEVEKTLQEGELDEEEVWSVAAGGVGASQNSKQICSLFPAKSITTDPRKKSGFAGVGGNPRTRTCGRGFKALKLTINFQCVNPSFN